MMDLWNIINDDDDDDDDEVNQFDSRPFNVWCKIFSFV